MIEILITFNYSNKKTQNRIVMIKDQWCPKKLMDSLNWSVEVEQHRLSQNLFESFCKHAHFFHVL